MLNEAQLDSLSYMYAVQYTAQSDTHWDKKLCWTSTQQKKIIPLKICSNQATPVLNSITTVTLSSVQNFGEINVNVADKILSILKYSLLITSYTKNCTLPIYILYYELLL